MIRHRALAAIFAGAVLLAGGCGTHENAGHHGAVAATPAPAPPTPDTTPIEALRTPAGMVLRLDAPTAAPAVTPTPAK